MTEESKALVNDLLEIPETEEESEQLKSEETLPEAKIPTIENHPRCAECRGWCCYRFQITTYPKENGAPDWDRTYKEGMINEHDFNFIKDNFVVKPQCPSLGSSFSPEGMRPYTFQCRAYDINRGICTKYTDRPELCKKYKCSVEDGEDPNKTGDNNRTQKGCMRRRGIKI